MPLPRIPLSLFALALAGCASAPGPAERYDLIIRNGKVYDGSGAPALRVDVAVRAGRIAALLPAGSNATATQVLDARGRAVAPGFINMLSWANESLRADGRGMSDTKQGVTLEVMGEGWSMGPLNARMQADALKQLIALKADSAIWYQIGSEEGDIRRNPQATGDRVLIGAFAAA